MAFDFPFAPSEGQIFNAPSGPTYVYNNPVWRAVGQGQIVVIADTFPVNPANGQLHWESDTGLLFVYYNDGNSSQWVQCGGTYPPSGLTAETRSRIVNGAMQVSQENGNTGGTTTGYFAADQWMASFVTTGTVTFLRVQSVTPNGSQNRLRLAVNVADTSLAATEFAHIWQPIEGTRIADFRWGTAQARQVILRFGWKSPAGTYTVAIENGATDRSYIAPFTISAGDANTDTVQTLVIPGDTTGTWPVDTSRGMILTFAFAVGSNRLGVAGWQAGDKTTVAGTTNGLGVINNICELYDVGLYLDPDATGVPPKWTMPDEAEELRACQRYYEKGVNFFSGNVVSGFNYYTMIYWKATKRITPAVTGTGGSVAGFSATVGSFAGDANYTQETRVGNAAQNGGYYSSAMTANARM